MAFSSQAYFVNRATGARVWKLPEAGGGGAAVVSSIDAPHSTYEAAPTVAARKASRVGISPQPSPQAQAQAPTPAPATSPNAAQKRVNVAIADGVSATLPQLALKKKQAWDGGGEPAGRVDVALAGGVRVGLASSLGGKKRSKKKKKKKKKERKVTIQATPTPLPPLPPGTRVEARATAEGKFYRGRVTRENTDDGSFDVTFDDGTRRERVPGEHIRVPELLVAGERAAAAARAWATPKADAAAVGEAAPGTPGSAVVAFDDGAYGSDDDEGDAARGGGVSDVTFGTDPSQNVGRPRWGHTTFADAAL